jgi:hypothetical protein
MTVPLCGKIPIYIEIVPTKEALCFVAHYITFWYGQVKRTTNNREPGA